MAGDNPFARFKAPGAEVTVEENPFRQFQNGLPGQSPAEEVGNRFSTFAFGKDDPTPSKPAGIDFSRPVADVRSDIGRLSATEKPAALRQWADQYVANERKNGGVGQYVSDIARNLARGTPVGSWLDEANAATAAGVHKVTGGKFGAPYDEAKAYQDALDRAVDADTVHLGTIPNGVPLVGGTDITGAGITKLAGGVASVPAMPFVASAPGATLPQQLARGVATGASYGAAYGSGEGEGAERVRNAIVGGATGTAFGAAAPIVGRTVGNVVNQVAGPTVPQPLKQFAPGAVERVARAHEADAGLAAPKPLLPEAMLLDTGQNLRLQGSGLSSQPGDARSRIIKALMDRREGASNRISADLDPALGPAQNLVELEKWTMDQVGRRAKPLYDQFYNSDVPMTPDLASVLQRADAVGAFASAKKLTEASRPPRSEAEFYDYVKRAVDDMASGAKAKQSWNEHRIYSQLAGDLRSAVDNSLSPGRPGDSVWARARAMAGEGQQFREGLDDGGKAFSRGTHPDQLRADMKAMSMPQRLGYVYGARGQVRDTIGNAASALRQNGDIKAMQQLGSPYAREKIAMIAPSPEAARRLSQRLDAEAGYANTYNKLVENSETAPRLAAQKEFPVAGEVSATPDYTNVTLTGAVTQGVRKIIDTLRDGKLSAAQMQINRDAARMLVAQGADRDAIIAALNQYVAQKGVSALQRRAVENIVRSLVGGWQSLSISSMTKPAELPARGGAGRLALPQY